MTSDLDEIKKEVYDRLSLEISAFELELEGTEYQACRFKLGELNIICRNSKITPTKTGQFVTFWKRSENGPIAPFDVTDLFDFYIVNVRNEDRIGQFVFPKSVLISKGIVSKKKKEGKRAFRVYAPWDSVTSKQARRSQKWQANYFYEISSSTDFAKAKELYRVK